MLQTLPETSPLGCNTAVLSGMHTCHTVYEQLAVAEDGPGKSWNKAYLSCAALLCPPGAQKDMCLAAYGERFAAAGLASFIFDYRTFGGSDGEPRHWVSPKRHIADWQSAITYVTLHLSDTVDTSKLMLWSTSFGAGHALTIAAQLGDKITAVVAQVGSICST